ncbi:MAG: caspase family protein, partial [Isosphaeraceae bacterium]|nr:caspase family protein [Isosphaeraceae bacterium]
MGGSKRSVLRIAMGVVPMLAAGVGLILWHLAWLPGRPAAVSPPSALRLGPESHPSGPIAAERAPAVWGIIIGIDQYQDEAIPACHGAVADARAVARWLAETAGWGEDHVLLLIDDVRPRPGSPSNRPKVLRPTRANLDWAIQRWGADRVTTGDVVVVYFAGQAIGLPPPAEAAPGTPGSAHLLPIDARLADPVRTGWAIDEALDELAVQRDIRVVCWLDTSLLGRGRRIDAEADDRAAATLLLQRLTRWPGSTAWLAAEGQVAAEAARVGERSPFSAALLQALGTSEQPNNLLACLDALQHDATVMQQGFRMMGGIAPELDLWSGQARLRGGAERALLLQRGHANAILSMAFSADGSRLITGGNDSVIKIWRVEDRMLLQSLAYHLVGVTALALSPDGRYLASGDGSGRLRLWDLRDHREITIGPSHEQGVAEIAFLPGGTRFTSLDRDGKAWLWNATDPTRGARPLTEVGTGLACASGVGPLSFAVAELDGKIRLFGREGTPIRELDSPPGVITSRRLATDGRLLVAGDDERGRLIIWDMETGKPIPDCEFGAPIDLVRLFPNGLLTVVTEKRIHVISCGTQSRDEVARLEVGEPLNQLLASLDGRWLAACTTGGSVLAWRRDDAGQFQPFTLAGAAETGLATAIAISPDSRTLAAGDQDGGMRFWDLPSGGQRARVPPRRGQIAALSVSDEGRYLLQVTKDRAVQVWDLQEGRAPMGIEGNWSTGVIAPEGASVALIEQESGDVVVVDRETGRRRPIRFQRPPTVGVPCRFGVLTFDPKGQF